MIAMGFRSLNWKKFFMLLFGLSSSYSLCAVTPANIGYYDFISSIPIQCVLNLWNHSRRFQSQDDHMQPGPLLPYILHCIIKWRPLQYSVCCIMCMKYFSFPILIVQFTCLFLQALQNFSITDLVDPTYLQVTCGTHTCQKIGVSLEMSLSVSNIPPYKFKIYSIL